MSQCALTLSELFDYNRRATEQWRQWFTAHPEALDVACDIAGTKDVAEVVQHIFAVELRYSEQLNGMPISEYSALPSSGVEALFRIHDRGLKLLDKFISEASAARLEEVRDFRTRSLGSIRATPRAILVHALLHGMRHWAQLATVLRHAGMPASLRQDYIAFFKET